MGPALLHDAAGGAQVLHRSQRPQGVLPYSCCHQGTAGNLPSTDLRVFVCSCVCVCVVCMGVGV